MKKLTPKQITHAVQLVIYLAGYDCAGVDQEPDDTSRCGKCAVCEANDFLREIGAVPSRRQEDR